MGKEDLFPFARRLAEAIADAGFETPTQLARAIGVDPSVVSRWLAAETRPTIALLQRVAPALNLDPKELVDLVYPGLMTPLAPRAPAGQHILVRDLALLLAKDSPLPADERHLLEQLIDRVIDPYRRHLRRRRSA